MSNLNEVVNELVTQALNNTEDGTYQKVPFLLSLLTERLGKVSTSLYRRDTTKTPAQAELASMIFIALELFVNLEVNEEGAVSEDELKASLSKRLETELLIYQRKYAGN